MANFTSHQLLQHEIHFVLFTSRFSWRIDGEYPHIEMVVGQKNDNSMPNSPVWFAQAPAWNIPSQILRLFQTSLEVGAQSETSLNQLWCQRHVLLAAHVFFFLVLVILWCQPWINKPCLRLFNWWNTINKYQMKWLLEEYPLITKKS